MSNEVIEATAEVIEPSNALEVTYTPAVLADNLEALNAFVEQQIAPYVGAKIDPNDYEQVKMARKCMADLNKLKDPIDKERKRVKREYEAPLKEFEGRVKAITAKIDGARAALKAQVDEADERFREMRRALLIEEYEGCAGPIADVIPFAAILEDAWLNRSTPETKAVNELYEKVEKALKGYKTLQTKELAHKDEVVKHYAGTLDLIAALELEDRLNERDREMAEFKAAQEAARLVAEERKAPEPEPEPEPQAAPAVPERFSWALSMEFEGTKEFATSVAHALKGLGLTGASIVCTGVIGHD
ncbi:DUF1351 domain-containing protein [Adlercreutzia equolifaciens]|uniref:DUF1351 domain-containing protein n=1 Tax=Adlercreutzia TaxID=447020 RepID=UPI001D07A961|nr:MULTISPECIES: DUF1351 domain-containing protein [Adlercreutzia]MCB6760083.1 DUF1351 domain-containing protein [Adlercreutzia equolifaciens]MCB6975698.1 DUF1351 domain-containing protein [Adlercreutzia equolifaciens]MCQ5070822.1 DUF1351 domain-containing protein [Adlercreutzia sp. DFI.6.23]MDE8683842.1 DUF1351 domain-containing protein [Adlercreutzia rubneri]